MKLALIATIVCAGGIMWGAITLINKTPYWWASIILGIAFFFGLYVGIRARERKAEQRKSTKDK